jgi:small subunit ribosomal protein S24e
MEVKVLSERYNPLLRRREIQVEISHLGQGTPTRASAKELLASELKLDKEILVIRKIITKTGMNKTICEAEVYGDPELMKMVFPKHIIERETPKEGQGASE